MKYLILSLMILFIGCQWTPTEPEAVTDNGPMSETGSVSMSLDLLAAPPGIVGASGSLTRDGEVTRYFDFIVDSTDTASVFVDGLTPGPWSLEISSYDLDGNLTHAGSGIITILARQTTSIDIYLTAVGDPDGGVKIVIHWLDRSPILDYRFDGNSLDSGPYENHGTVFGATLSSDRGYDFNGSNAIIVPNNSNILKTQLPITISVWVNIIDDDRDTAEIFTNNLSDGYSGVWMTVVKNDTAENGMDRGIEIVLGYGDGGSDSSSFRQVTTTTGAPSFTWCHVIGVIRGPNDMDIYISGMHQLVAYEGSGSVLAYDSGPAVIGNHFRGSIDGLRFFNAALTETEILDLGY